MTLADVSTILEFLIFIAIVGYVIKWFGDKLYGD